MPTNSRQRSIFITGCSTGIGAHCARRLKENGWLVFASARKPQDLERLKTEGMVPIYLDYTEQASISRAIRSVLEQTDGRLDALFNNGAFGQPGAVEDLTTATLRRQFEANFFGWHELTNLAIPVMRKQGSGRIIHCSSVLGLTPLKWRGAYIASKFALEGLATTMRMELEGTEIHLSLIEPGPIESEFTTNSLINLRANVDMENSVHAETYRKELARLEAKGGSNRMRLTPEAVYKKLDHALNNSNPAPHYHVTIPTHLMAVLRRILPARLLYRFCSRNS